MKKLNLKTVRIIDIQAGDEFGYECAVLNDMPDLLEVWGGFQEGDAMLLDWMLQENDGFEEYQWTEELQEQIANMLRRYRDMAHAMEEHR